MLGYSHSTRPFSSITEVPKATSQYRRPFRPAQLIIEPKTAYPPHTAPSNSRSFLAQTQKENKTSSLRVTPEQFKRQKEGSNEERNFREDKLNELYQQLVTGRSRKVSKTIVEGQESQQDIRKQLRQTINIYSTLSQNLFEPFRKDQPSNTQPLEVKTPLRRTKRVSTVLNTQGPLNFDKKTPQIKARTPTLTPNKSQINLHPPQVKAKRERSVSQNQLILPMTPSTPLRSPTSRSPFPMKSPTLRSRKSSRTETAPTELSLSDFNLGECKGQGRFGKVYLAVHKRTGFTCAIKQIKKESVRLMMDQFIRQIKISLFLNHPNLVKMYGCFSDKENLYILMEYMEEGSLFKYIRTNKKLDQDNACSKLFEVSEAVSYLHRNDILHRDIKPQNIVMSHGVCKLCDFGWAVCSTDRRNTYCGTLDYACPEILQGNSYDNFVDVWAVGVLAYEMLTGKAPFYNLSRKETMKSIMKCQFTYPPEVTHPAQQFIDKAVRKDPESRSTIESLLKHPFLAKAAKPLC